MAFGQELVILHTTPSIFSKFVMLRVSVEVRVKDILYRFVEGQTRFGHAKRC